MSKRSLGAMALAAAVLALGLLFEVRLLQFLGGVTMLIVLIGQATPNALLAWGLRPGDDARRGQDRFGGSVRRR